jgi:hypothetical protein
LLVVGSLEHLSVQLVSSCDNSVEPGFQALALCLSPLQKLSGVLCPTGGLVSRILMLTRFACWNG